MERGKGFAGRTVPSRVRPWLARERTTARARVRVNAWKHRGFRQRGGRLCAAPMTKVPPRSALFGPNRGASQEPRPGERRETATGEDNGHPRCNLQVGSRGRWRDVDRPSLVLQL